MFLKSWILVQIVLYFYNSFSSSIRKDIDLLFLSLSPSLMLNVSTYPLIFGIIKTNSLITLATYLIKYLTLVFVLINFEITMLSTSTSQVFIVFLQTFLLLLFSLQISTLLNYQKKIAIIFYLIDASIFLKISYSRIDTYLF